MCNRNIRNRLKRPVFGRYDGIWVDILATVTKQCNNRLHSSTEKTPTLAALKRMKDVFTKILLDKRKKVIRMFKIHDRIRVAILKKTFSRGGTTNWS